MSSEVKANKLSPATGTDFTFGDSGDTFTVPSGATITNSGTATGFGDDNSPAFEATVGSVQAGITSGVATKVAFNTEVFDVGGNYDHATNYRFVAPEAAKYFMYSCNRLVGDGGIGTLYEAYSYFYLNGSGTDYLTYYDFRGPGGMGDSLLSFTITNSVIMDLAENDYVEVFANVGTSTSTWTVQNNLGAFFGFKMAGI